MTAGFEEVTVTLPDGYRSYGRYWNPGELRGAVLYHHGIQSHCGWYERSPAWLAEAGYAVLQVDRRGSGRNPHQRGHAESTDQLAGDALAARDFLITRTGLTRHHVLGVSWGGKLAVAAYVAAPADVASLTLVTPGIFPRIGVSKAEMARIGFAMLYESTKLFDIPLNDAELFTASPQWQAFIGADPLTLRQCTAGFYLASRRMDKAVGRLRDGPPVPIHLCIAADERIIDNDKTMTFVRELHWPRCRITRYSNARHSLEFEGDPEAYFSDLVDFLRAIE